MNGTVTIAEAGPYSYTSPMTAILIGYARCSTDRHRIWRPSARGSGSLAWPRIASTPITASPAPPAPDPALATFAEFEADLIRLRTREGIDIARTRGNCAASSPKFRPTAAGTLPHACHGRVFHQRPRRARLRLKTNRLSHAQPAPFALAYDPAPYWNRPLPVEPRRLRRRLGNLIDLHHNDRRRHVRHGKGLLHR